MTKQWHTFNFHLWQSISQQLAIPINYMLLDVTTSPFVLDVMTQTFVLDITTQTLCSTFDICARHHDTNIVLISRALANWWIRSQKWMVGVLINTDVKRSFSQRMKWWEDLSKPLNASPVRRILRVQLAILSSSVRTPHSSSQAPLSSAAPTLFIS